MRTTTAITIRPRRWRRLPAVLALLAMLGSMLLPAALAAAPIAQDGTDGTGAAPAAARGELPTTGGQRPGPIGVVVPRAAVAPVAIRIEKAAVDALVEPTDIVDGVMQNPSGPWVVAWYDDLAKLGQRDNVVMAGHVDYWEVGAAVFYNLGLLVEGDVIEVTGANNQSYRYAVQWMRAFDASASPDAIEEIVGDTEVESLTLITCTGDFNYETGEYPERMVLRAERI